MKSNLLNIYRMMGKPKEPTPPSEGYIKDGLVFHLDGIDKGDDPTAWTDLVGGIPFTYNDCIINKDNVEFNGTSSYADSDDASIQYPASTHTIEFACQIDRGERQDMSVFAARGGLSAIYSAYYAGVFYDTVGGRNPYITNWKGDKTMSINSDIAYLNRGKLEKSSDRDRFFADGSTSVGCRVYQGNPDKYFRGKIYSIRIYDRRLTPEEMIHNQEVDIKRFNLSFGYIKFEDPEVERICVQNWSSDGVGLTYEDAANVTDLGGVFNRNKKIKKFIEFKYFTNVTSIPSTAFEWSTIEAIELPNACKSIYSYAFSNSPLRYLHNMKVIEVLGAQSLQGTQINGKISLPILREIGPYSFESSEITEVDDLGGITKLNDLTLSKCEQLTKLVLPSSLVKIGNYAIERCYILSTIICKAINPPTLSANSLYFTNNIDGIYVPDASVDAYKTAPVWSNYADKIKPLSEYVEPVNN